MNKNDRECDTKSTRQRNGENHLVPTITISPFVAIKTGASVCTVPIYTCSIHAWVWIAIVDF